MDHQKLTVIKNKVFVVFLVVLVSALLLNSCTKDVGKVKDKKKKKPECENSL